MSITEASGVQSFYNKYDLSKDKSFSKKETLVTKGNFTKSFLTANRETQKSLLSSMPLDAKNELFRDIKGHYLSAANASSKNTCLRSLLPVAASIILDKQSGNSPKDLTVKILKFMNNNVTSDRKAERPENRDACQWPGVRVLAEGNFNGCVEGCKLFNELYNECAAQTGLPKSNYISSFNVNKATVDNLNSKTSPAGHSLIEISSDQETFYVDGSMLENSTLGAKVTDKELSSPSQVNPNKFGHVIQSKENNTDFHIEKTAQGYKVTHYQLGRVFDKSALIGNQVGFPEVHTFKTLQETNTHLQHYSTKTSFSDLEKANIIKRVDKKNMYAMQTEAGLEQYMLFGRGKTYNRQSNPANPFDPNTSNGATRNAIKNYLELK
jgi:hypothetical protein